MTLTADRLPDSAPLPRDLLTAGPRAAAGGRRGRGRNPRARAGVRRTPTRRCPVRRPGRRSSRRPGWTPGSELRVDDEDREMDRPAGRALGRAWPRSRRPTACPPPRARRCSATSWSWRTGPRGSGPRCAMAGKTPAWRARRVAQALLGQPADVCRYVDDSRSLSGSRPSGAIGPVILDRLVDEAHAAAARRGTRARPARGPRRPARHHRPGQSINHTGIAEMDARADWADLSSFDEDALGGRRGDQAPARAPARVPRRAPLDRAGDPRRPSPRPSPPER